MKIVPIVLFLGVIALIAGALALVNNDFRDTVSDKCFNSSFTINSLGTACTNTSPVNVTAGCCGQDGLNLSDQAYVITKGDKANLTVAKQMPTIGIIAAMVIIITLLVSVFAVVGMRRVR